MGRSPQKKDRVSFFFPLPQDDGSRAGDATMQCFRTALLLLASAPSSARASVDTFLISSGDLRVRVSYEGDSPDAYPLLLNLAGNGGWNYMSDDV